MCKLSQEPPEEVADLIPQEGPAWTSPALLLCLSVETRVRNAYHSKSSSIFGYIVTKFLRNTGISIPELKPRFLSHTHTPRALLVIGIYRRHLVITWHSLIQYSQLCVHSVAKKKEKKKGQRPIPRPKKLFSLFSFHVSPSALPYLICKRTLVLIVTETTLCTAVSSTSHCLSCWPLHWPRETFWAQDKVS